MPKNRLPAMMCRCVALSKTPVELPAGALGMLNMTASLHTCEGCHAVQAAAVSWRCLLLCWRRCIAAGPDGRAAGVR